MHIEARHAYASANHFVAQLTVFDSAGEQTTCQADVDIVASPVSPRLWSVIKALFR
jgi:hypothetical protein